MKLLRAHTLRFELPTGEVLLVPPISRAQVRAALALDPGEDTDALRLLVEADERRAAQLTILIRHGTVEAGNRESRKVDAEFLGSLAAPEEHDILTAIIVHHHGFDPLDAVAINVALRRLALKKKWLGELPTNAPATPSSASTPTPSTSPTA